MMGLSALSEGICSAVSLQEALKAMAMRDREFSKHTQSSALPHTFLTPRETGAGCWKWGNEKGMDGILVPNSLHCARHTDTSGFRVQISSQTLSHFWHHRQEGNFSLGKQLLEAFLARCWLLLAFVLQQLSQQVPGELWEMPCNFVLCEAPHRNIWP